MDHGNKTLNASETDIDAAKKALQDGTMRYLVYGQVTYDDIFERPHWLIFCERLFYDPIQPGDGGWSWGTYKEYNDTGDGHPPD